MPEPSAAVGSGPEIVLRTVRLERADDADGWREAARAHLAAGTPPEALVWETGTTASTGDLFGEDASEAEALPAHARRSVPPVPRAFVDLAERVVCHRAPDRFALLYRVLWRRANGEPELLDCAGDPDVHRLQRLGKAVARERHKMHAFVRFRRTPGVEPEHFGAWFEPEHHTLRLASGFFVRRFANMRFSIVTPEESAHWNGETLVFGPGGRRGDGPEAEAMEALWRTYFANIFNPARLRLDAMRSEMPIKYWKNLPEAPLIAELVRQAGRRAEAMVDAAPSEPPRFAARAVAPVASSAGAGSDRVGFAATTFAEAASAGAVYADATVASGSAGVVDAPARVPSSPEIETFPDLAALHARARRCERCEHACLATQTVNGEGAADARLMIVGEQAGDREDLRGRPFVGPAGVLLRELLELHGAAPGSVYLTNAVRHFRYAPRGKRRLHRRPTTEHIDRCRSWLFEEIRLVRPRVIVALGATAGRALLGRAVEVKRERGTRVAFGPGCTVHLSAHPAAILREPDADAREALGAALSRELADAIAAAREDAAADTAVSNAS